MDRYTKAQRLAYNRQYRAAHQEKFRKGHARVVAQYRDPALDHIGLAKLDLVAGSERAMRQKHQGPEEFSLQGQGFIFPDWDV